MELSKRQQRKKARGAGVSRCTRRALKRLNSKMAAWEINNKKHPGSVVKPGAMKRW